jgi:hypothetical protein
MADVFMGNKLTLVQLSEASGDLGAEPSIVLDVAFDQVLNVFGGVAMRFGSDGFDSGLQFGVQEDFHKGDRQFHDNAGRAVDGGQIRVKKLYFSSQLSFALG